MVGLARDDQRRERAGGRRAYHRPRSLGSAAVSVKPAPRGQQGRRRNVSQDDAGLLSDPPTRDGEREEQHDADEGRDPSKPRQQAPADEIG